MILPRKSPLHKWLLKNPIYSSLWPVGHFILGHRYKRAKTGLEENLNKFLTAPFQ